MSELREAMAAALGTTSRDIDEALGEVRRRASRHDRRQRAITIFTAVLLSSAATVLVWSGFRQAEVPAPRTSVSLEVATEVSLDGSPVSLAAGDEGVWAAVESLSGEGGAVVRIDPRTNAVAQTIAIDRAPGWLAVGEGSVWVATEGSIQRLDPDSGEIVAEVLGVAGFVAVTPGAVWALATGQELARIDPDTNEVVATVPLDLPPDGYVTGPPVGTENALWVVASLGSDAPDGTPNGVLIRVDPTSDLSVATAAIPAAPSMFAADDEFVWVATWETEVTHLTQIAASSAEPLRQIELEGGWIPFAVGMDTLWLMGGAAPQITLMGLDTTTLERTETVVVGRMPAFEGSGVLDPVSRTLWVAQEHGSLTRVNVAAPARG